MRYDKGHDHLVALFVVTMRVRDLVLHQIAGFVLHFDYLICEELADRKTGRRRLRVRDRSDEFIRFVCDSFVALPANEQPAAS